MTDFLIVNSSSEDYDKTSTSYPLGVCYLASAAEAKGFSVEAFDSYREPWRAAATKFEQRLRETKPEVVGFSCLSFNRNSTRAAARMVKRIFPAAVTVCGGPHASLMQEQILQHYDMDIVARGEGEATLVELIGALKNGKPLDGIAGIAYKSDGGVRIMPDREFIHDLDSLPFPKHELYADWIRAERRAVMISTRGCPARCHFCASPLQLGSRYRVRSAENIVNEIKELYERYRIEALGFQDDAFTLNRKRTEDFCERMAAAALPIIWAATTRVTAFDVEIAAMMYRAGCRHMAFGVESGSEKLLRAMNKKILPEQIVKAYRTAHEAGFTTGILLMVGTPGESWQTVKETIRLVRRLQPSMVKSISLLQVFPGTHWYEYSKGKGFLSDDYWLTENPVPYFTFEHSELVLSYYGFMITLASHWYRSPSLGIKYFFSAIRRYAPRIRRAAGKFARKLFSFRRN